MFIIRSFMNNISTRPNPLYRQHDSRGLMERLRRLQTPSECQPLHFKKVKVAIAQPSLQYRQCGSRDLMERTHPLRKLSECQSHPHPPELGLKRL